MKKTAVSLLFVILFSLGGIAVSAEGAPYKTAGELYQAWCDGSAQQPDYICGVWSSDGGFDNLTFGIQNTDEGNLGKQEMLDLIEDDSSVSFEYQKYSVNYLNQINDEILPYFEQDVGLISLGVYVMENHVGVEILESRKKDAETKSFVKELEAKYGDAVCVTFAENHIVATTEQLSTDQSSGGLAPMARMMMAFTLVLALTAGLFFAVKSKARTLVTNTGSTAASSADIENMAAQNEDTPSRLDEKINSFLDSQ